MKRVDPALFLFLCFFSSTLIAQQSEVRPTLLPWHERTAMKKLILSADGQFMVTTGDDQAAMISDLKKRMPLVRIPGIMPEFLAADPTAPFFYTMTETSDSLYLQRRSIPSGALVHVTPVPRRIPAGSFSMPTYGYLPLVDIDFNRKTFRLCYNQGDFSSAMRQAIVEFSEDGNLLRQVSGIDEERVNAILEIRNEIWVATASAIWKQKGTRFEKILAPPVKEDRFANMQYRNDTLVLLSGFVQWIDARNMKTLAQVSVKDFYATGDQDYSFASVMQFHHSFIFDETGVVWLANTRRQEMAPGDTPGNRIYYVAKINKEGITYPLLTAEPSSFREKYKEVSTELAYCPATSCFAFISERAGTDIVSKDAGHLFSLNRKNIAIENFYLTAEPGKLVIQVGSYLSDGMILDLSNGKLKPVSLRKDYHINTDRFRDSRAYQRDTAITRLYSPSRNGFIPAGNWRKGADLRINLPKLDSCKILLENGNNVALNGTSGVLSWTDKNRQPTKEIPLHDEENRPLVENWRYETFIYDSTSSVLTIYWESRSASLTKLVHIIRLDEKKLLRTWRIRDLLVLPGGKQFVTGHGIFNLADSTVVTKFPEGYSYADRFVTGNDARFISFIIEKYTADDDIYTWDNKLKEITLNGSQASIDKIVKDPHSPFIFTLGRDQKIKIWNPAANQVVAEIVVDANREQYSDPGELQPGYLVILPDGYYMGDNRYYEMLTWRDDKKEFPVFQMDAKFHRPDKVLKTLGYAENRFVESLSRVAAKRSLRSAISSANEDVVIHHKQALPYATRTQQVVLPLALSALPKQEMGLMIYVNGTALWPFPGKPLSGFAAGKTVNQDISLVDAGNHIRVCLSDKDGKETPGDYVYINAAPVKKRDLYFVGIGVSQYKDAQYNLRYASKDMEDIHKYFKTTSSFEKVKAFTVKDQRVTAAVVDSIRLFVQTATAKDQVIVYYAGHGMLDTVSGNYFLSTHAWQHEQLLTTGLNIDDLNNAIAASPARKKVMMIDACNSGLVDATYVPYDDEDTSSAVTARGFKVKNRSQDEGLVHFAFNHFNQGNGVDILAASAGNEFAFETDSLKNGLFTYSLLSAFKSGDADLDKDSILSVSEIQQYVGNMVKRLSKGRQQPSFRQANLYQDIAMLTSDDSYFAAMLWGAQNNHVPTLKICIEKENIPVNKKDERGFTALHYACREGGYNAVKYLMENNADITLRTEFDFSCLYLAAVNRHERIVHYLLSNGAVVKDQVNRNLSMDTLRKRTSPFILDMLADFNKTRQRDEKQYQLIRFLAVGNVSSADSAWKTDSLDAAYWHYGEGINALFTVILQKQQESLAWLMERKVNVNYTNADIGGFTPLMAAAYANNIPAVKVLLQHGADKSTRDKNGKTALQIAKQNGSQEIASLLSQ